MLTVLIPSQGVAATSPIFMWIQSELLFLSFSFIVLSTSDVCPEKMDDLWSKVLKYQNSERVGYFK